MACGLGSGSLLTKFSGIQELEGETLSVHASENKTKQNKTGEVIIGNEVLRGCIQVCFVLIFLFVCFWLLLFVVLLAFFFCASLTNSFEKYMYLLVVCHV